MRLKIYYLDDEDDLLEVFADTFSNADNTITTFSDPALALEAIRSSPPDLLFIDYRLPNTTGDEFAQKIDASIPKILMTGDTHLTLESKFETVLEKPYSVSEVRKWIAQYLEKLRLSPSKNE